MSPCADWSGTRILIKTPLGKANIEERGNAKTAASGQWQLVTSIHVAEL